MAIIGIDLGSTGCKAMVFTPDGEVLSHAYKKYDKISPSKINPNVLKQTVFNVIGKAAAGIADIASICISSFGESFVLLDELGRPFDHILGYTDPRGQSCCDLPTCGTTQAVCFLWYSVVSRDINTKKV